MTYQYLLSRQGNTEDVPLYDINQKVAIRSLESAARESRRAVIDSIVFLKHLAFDIGIRVRLQ
jgi:hypothetical protein